MDFSELLFSFQGRVNRGKYWLVGFLVIVVCIAYFALGFAALFDSIGDLFSFAGTSLMFWLLGVVLFVAITWIGLAVGVKRLHDRNKSGWWIVLFYYAPSILNAPSSQVSNGTTLFLGIVGFVISIWGFIELGCLRGTPGTNQYGPDPLGRLSTEPLR